MSKVTLGHNGEQKTATLKVSVGIKDLNDSYQWLLGHCIESNPDPVEIIVNPKTMKVELEPGLEGLLNFLEDIRERIDEAEEAVKHTEPLDLEAEQREPRDDDYLHDFGPQDDCVDRDEALENHFDQREHYKEI